MLGTAARETHGLVHCIDLFPRLEDWFRNPDGTYSFSVEMNGQRHSGYQVGGTSPFGFRKDVPVYVERTILELPRILINGGRRGFLVGLAPAVLTHPLGAKPVECALPG